MTDLQLILLMLGLVIIASVVLFNWWQERKLRNEAAERFVAPERDVLMDQDFKIDTDTAILQEDIDEAMAHYALEDELPLTETAAELEEFERDIATRMPQLAHTPKEDIHAEPAISENMISDADEIVLEQPIAPPQPAYEPIEPLLEDVRALVDEVGFANAIHDEIPIQKEIEESVSLPETIYHQIDLAALLYLPHPLTGLKLRDFFLSFADVDKAIYAYGLGADNHWYLLTRDHEQAEFKKVACSLQLADRSGAVSKETLFRFQNGIDEIGLQLGAQVEWHGNPDPLSYANELDQFCIDVDKLVSLHVIQGSSGPFTGTKFRGLAEAGGLILGDDGAFHYEADGIQLFSLVNQDNNPFTLEMLRTVVLRGVSIQLDIPRVKNSAEVFNQMVLVAKQMAHSLNASLVDDNQRPLGELQIDKIRQQLKIIHAHMVTRGVVPGSACALRLFS
ncbi:hypothetical protein A7981_06300 [Methylovorus sp. MM2]|uniref:cell division protein ZipA C-terminal FtsZ-binding domain-containing protein n=1 Tax=Methylovorus sp. MM2 TaxID=1848038 RepID=UPI0007E13473|nr:cell division protein ZipA C-terminal FtsZ-binding domain-containing protein [Methylovorus sp. MM2]OAM53032.1 hypothetical protein A7981_06300 [Methylovorus sp. MM2]